MSSSKSTPKKTSKPKGKAVKTVPKTGGGKGRVTKKVVTGKEEGSVTETTATLKTLEITEPLVMTQVL